MTAKIANSRAGQCRPVAPWLVGLTACGIWASGVANGQDGLLQGLRDAARNPAPSASDANKPDKPRHDDEHGHSSWFHDDDAEASMLCAMGKLACWAVTAPFWGPKLAVGDGTLEPGAWAPYPYAHDLDGYLVPSVGSEMQEHPWLQGERQPWLLRASGEYGTDLDDVSRFGGRLLFDTASRFGADASVDSWRENLPGSSHDRLWLGDINLVYRFAQSPRMQMRAGLGCNWLADAHGSDFGFDFTYGGDFFPVQPLVLSAEIDWGWLGHAGLFHGRATAGINYRRFEVYAGYDYLDVGDTQWNGLISGVRVWY